MCVEGESGLLSVLPGSAVKKWNRSHGKLTLANGAQYQCFSADEPNRLRGPQHHMAWADELAAWAYADTWDQLMFGLRLGVHPVVIATTTPRPVKLIKELLKREGRDVVVTRGNTFENAAHLSGVALNQFRERYEGTRIGRQELYAEVLDDVEGALWTYGLLEELRNAADDYPDDLRRVVIGVDPAATKSASSSETGIVAAGSIKRNAWVLADRSGTYSPHEWGSKAIATLREFGGDMIVAEKNNGGDMVQHVIHSIDARVRVKLVHASRGKIRRAEPVAGLYEQKLVRHCGTFRLLEDQMCGYTPESESEGKDSPDRMDALVWAIHELLLSNLKRTVPVPRSHSVRAVSPYSV